MRTRQAVLLGNPDTKRTIYLEQAAERTGLPVLFLDWDGWKEKLPKGDLFLKVDPPLWKSCSLEELNGLVHVYKQELMELIRLSEKRYAGSIAFFNHPLDILTLLDKKACKKRLMKAGIPVTEELDITGLCEEGSEYASLDRAEQLLEIMRQRGVPQVFIKPVYGSGAAGVSAFRYQSKTGRMALYTCAALDWQNCGKTGYVRGMDGQLFNTKRLCRYSQPDEVCGILNRLLEMDCIIERWHAKAEYHGMSYDLRVVMQEGRMDYMLARLSNGPITNLHLNNHPLETEKLGLSGQILEQIEEVCRHSMECFPGLRSAGIDVLLERGSKNPRVIEMNAQGDLIYQDIYHENVIYGHQAEIMKKWLARQDDRIRAEKI